MNQGEAQEQRGTECTEEAEPVHAGPARPGWKSSQASGLGKESADIATINPDVSGGGSSQSMSVAPLSVTDSINISPV